jgi:hypothetical protein
MVEEATSIPSPLIVDRSQLKTTPDASGIQHSELERLKDRSLWWVPSWAPAFIREGWSLGRRRPEVSPVHPSVFERFAAEAVIQATGTAAYRPINLADDERFAPYYSNTPSSDPLDLINFNFAAEDGSFEGSLEALSTTLANLLKREKVAYAAIVLLPPNTVEQHDEYRDELALRYFDQLIERGGWKGQSLTGSETGDAAQTRKGRLVIGPDENAALGLARSIGQMTTIVIGSDGRAQPLPSMPARSAS